MAAKRAEPESRSLIMLETLLVVQLYSMGAPQKVIARILGKSINWVNDTLKGIPKPTKGA
jgi:hypothetical protein